MITVNGRQLNITTFPNGERKIDVRLPYEDDRLRIVWRYENDGDFLLLNMLEDYIARNTSHQLDGTVDCYITSMPYERMDRSENGSVFSLRAAIKTLPMKWNYIVFAPHSDVTVSCLKDHVSILCDVRAVHVHEFLLKNNERHKETKRMWWHNRALVFPDKGAKDRYSDMVKSFDFIENNIQIIYGEKSRNFESGDIESLVFKNEDGSEVETLEDIEVIVMDDLSSFGGTFVRAAEALRKLNPSKLFLFLEKSEDSILKGNVLDHYDVVFTTNLMMDIQNDKKCNENLVVIDYSEILETIN